MDILNMKNEIWAIGEGCMQLELLQETHEEKLIRELDELKELVRKMRKALFAKNSLLAKNYCELKNEFDSLRGALCRGQHIDQIEEPFLRVVKGAAN